MGVLDVALIAVALSMDACAVAMGNILGLDPEERGRLWMMPVFFALFQMLMPAAGYLVGSVVAGYIGRYAPFLVAAVLGLLGFNMLRAGLGADETRQAKMELRLGTVLVQAFLTAIDALAVGVSFGALGVSPTRILLIGPITFFLVVLAIWLGRRLGELLGNKSELLGGILLMIVAMRALMETL